MGQGAGGEEQGLIGDTNVDSDSPNSHQPVPWCTEALDTPQRLDDVYLHLSKRERKRRSRQSSDTPNAYRSEHASLIVNQLRNRYIDIMPYDANRVQLPRKNCQSDYINASWIAEPGYDAPSGLDATNSGSGPYAPRRWIASQGPKRETRWDFLSLFLNPDPNLRPQTIIQLSACREGNREKTAPYVPLQVGETLYFSPCAPFRAHYANRVSSVEEEPMEWQLLNSLNDPDGLSYPSISVTLEESAPGPSYIQPSLSTSTYGQSRVFYRRNVLTINAGQALRPIPDLTPQLITQSRVIHYECIDWPDRGTPEAVEPILRLIQVSERENAQSLQNSTDQPHSPAPILVHCSAGVGRTGTFIAIASSIRRLTLLSHTCPEFASLSPDRKALVLSNVNQLGSTELHGDRLMNLPDDMEQDLIVRTVDHLREQRVCMVQTDKQLAFVYKAVAKVLHLLIYSPY